MTLAPPVRIVGCGSAFGDDALGWAVVEEVRRGLPPDGPEVAVHAVPAPHALLDLLDGQGSLVVVDAMIGAGTPAGTLHRFEWPDPALRRVGGASSTHGLGVAVCLDLAARLGRLPPRVVVYGIACDPPAAGRLAAPTGYAASAVAAAAHAILTLLRGGGTRMRGTPANPAPEGGS